MFFSDLFSLNISGHKDIDFVDIPLNTDVALYIDPTLLAAGTDQFSISAWSAVKSFFHLLFECCRLEDHVNINNLLTYVGEANETHLGLSKGIPSGKGASKKILLPILRDMMRRGFFKDGLLLDPHDLLVLAPNFSEDRMSDVIFNIIRNLACMFTIEQCVKHRILLDPEPRYSKPHWEVGRKNWIIGEWPVPYDQCNRPIVLIPKRVVRSSYSFGVSAYLQHFILEYRQEKHFALKTSLCREAKDKNGNHTIKQPYKKDVRQAEVVGRNVKDYVSEVTRECPSLITAFRNEVERQRGKADLTMSNIELDATVYRTIAS